MSVNLAQTWIYSYNGKKNVISLYHDTVTGLRSLTVNFEEVRESAGVSSYMMRTLGHRIFFTIEDKPGFVEIKKEGWTSFQYTCVVDNLTLIPTADKVFKEDEMLFRATITHTLITPDESVEDHVVWYGIESLRTRDNCRTIVHRRFKEFVNLDEQVRTFFGDLPLPDLPSKSLKFFSDHLDAEFIQNRRIRLDLYLKTLLNAPHVSEFLYIRAFLGFPDRVREMSLVFHVPHLDYVITFEFPRTTSSDNFNAVDEQSLFSVPAIVSSIEQPQQCPGVRVGDALSRINGVPVIGSTFRDVMMRLTTIPKPVVLHFIQLPRVEPDSDMPATPSRLSNRRSLTSPLHDDEDDTNTEITFDDEHISSSVTSNDPVAPFPSRQVLNEDINREMVPDSDTLSEQRSFDDSRASALESSAIQNGQANTVTSRESMTPVKRFSITSIIPPEAARTATHTVKGWVSSGSLSGADGTDTPAQETSSEVPIVFAVAVNESRMSNPEYHPNSYRAYYDDRNEVLLEPQLQSNTNRGPNPSENVVSSPMMNATNASVIFLPPRRNSTSSRRASGTSRNRDSVMYSRSPNETVDSTANTSTIQNGGSDLFRSLIESPAIPNPEPEPEPKQYTSISSGGAVKSSTEDDLQTSRSSVSEVISTNDSAKGVVISASAVAGENSEMQIEYYKAEDGDGSTPTSRRNSLSVAEQYIVSAAICMKARRLSKLTGEDDEKESVTRTGSVSEMITRSNKSTPKRSGEVSGISNEVDQLSEQGSIARAACSYPDDMDDIAPLTHSEIIVEEEHEHSYWADTDHPDEDEDVGKAVDTEISPSSAINIAVSEVVNDDHNDDEVGEEHEHSYWADTDHPDSDEDGVPASLIAESSDERNVSASFEETNAVAINKIESEVRLKLTAAVQQELNDESKMRKEQVIKERLERERQEQEQLESDTARAIEFAMLKHSNGNAGDDVSSSDNIEEIKRVAEAEVRAKFEKEAAIRALEEAKVREKTEEKLRVEAELRKRLENEAIELELREAKAREELEFKLKSEVQARSKLEQDVAALANRERLAREEVEIRLAKESSARKRLEEEAQARVAAEAIFREKSEQQQKEYLELKQRLEFDALEAVKRETLARKLAEDKLKAEAEARFNLETEMAARALTEAKVREEAEKRKQSELAAHAKVEQEAKLRIMAEMKAKEEAEARVRAEDEAKQRLEAERIARNIAEMKLKSEMEMRMKIEQEAKLRIEAETKARLEAEERARAEMEEIKRRLEAEAAARQLAEKKAYEEMEARLRTEQEIRMKLESEMMARSLAEKKAQEEKEARLKAAEEARKLLEAEAAEAKRRLEAEAAARAIAEAKAKEEAEIRERLEYEASLMPKTPSWFHATPPPKQPPTNMTPAPTETSPGDVYL